VRLAYTGPAVSGVLPQTRELRPAPLPSLYAGFAVLQALDAHSTTRALAGGAEERNPVVASVARSPAAVLGIKAAATLGTIWATERLWKRGHRRAAVLLMVALNAGYGLVVAHNYRTSGAAR
jgi:hypothetical protein